ncbi:MAG: uracil-DNA glycosylase, partial [Pseudomonadota bacterium]
MAQDSAPDTPAAATFEPAVQDIPAEAALALLQWYVDIGVETAINAQPASWTEHRRAGDPPPAPTAQTQGSQNEGRQPGAGDASQSAPLGTAEAVVAAERLAAEATTLDELRTVLEEFDGLSIIKTAQNLVFADGVAGSPLMIVGEAPGREEDAQGKPFVGASGQLLDRILKAIGRDRSDTYISNIVNWRPPGNRKPTTGEIEVCRPFIKRHIALAGPKVLVLMGDTAGKALLPVTQGITRYRGQWHDFDTAGEIGVIQAMATFHPAFLLRTPARKREVWLDFLKIAEA